LTDEQVSDLEHQRALGLEAQIGQTSDFLPFSFLELGRRRGDAVARVVIRTDGPGGASVQGYGTGFLIAPDILITNNHVLPNLDKARVSTVEFRYELDLLGNEIVPDAWALTPDELFVTSPYTELDFTIIKVAKKANTIAGDAYRFLPVRASPAKVAPGESVCVIQHPQGRRKEVVLFESRVDGFFQEGFVQYSSDTLEGSSGAPVFNSAWEVVALHHRGVIERDAAGAYVTRDGEYQYLANEGVRISAIASFCQSPAVPEPARTMVGAVFLP